MSSARLALVSTGAYSLASALPQLVSLLFLSETSFSRFSLAYLIFGLTTSVMLSVVAEAWTRSRHEFGEDRDDYFGAAAVISFVGGLVAAALVAVVSGAIGIPVILGLATAAASYWMAGRYRAVVEGTWRRLVVADVGGIVVGFLFWALGILFVGGKEWIVGLGWLAMSVVAIALGPIPKRAAPLRSADWVRSRRTDIKALLPESLLLDVGAVGTPLLLLPLLGEVSFGRYRAISNGAFPVRLALTALRPLMARVSLSRAKSLSTSIGLICGFCVIGAIVSGFVYWIGGFINSSGILGALRGYSAAVGIFAAMTGIGQTWYMFCRLHQTGRSLLTARLVQTLLVTVIPLAGFFLDGEFGAVWGFVLSAGLSAFIWLFVLQLAGSRAKPIVITRCADSRRREVDPL